MAYMVVNLVLSDPLIDKYVSLSPNGNKLAYTDWSTGNLAIKDISSGNIKILTDTDWSQSFEHALFSAWSPDGKNIAYSWFRKNDFYDLRIASADGSERTIIFSDSLVSVYLMDWSRDGRNILCKVEKKDKSNALGIVSIDSGGLRVLVALDSYAAQGAKLSPNGKFLAYDLVQEGNKDIFILSINEDAVTRLTNSPAEDVNPLWSPHGKNILFRSKRRGSWDLWGIGVNNGKAAGTPFLVKSNIGKAFLSTWTSNGKLLYGIENSMQDIYVVAVDLVSGMVTDQAYQFVKSYSGKNLRPMWSHDGKHLTYVSTRHDGRRTTACSLNLETGEEREIRPALNWIHTVRLSPNGKEVAVTGLDERDQRVAHLLSLETGEEKILIQEGDLGDWLPDGDEIIVWTSKPGSILKEPGFYSMNVKNGELKQIFTLPSEWAMSGLLELSSNGKKAFALVGNESGRALWILPFDGSKPEEILKCNRPANIATPTWSPDGKKIAYLYIDDMWGESEGYNIWVISVVGGTPKKLDIIVPGKIMIFRPAWSPDGTKIAFTIDRSVSEAWVMENFLPITETRE